MPGWAVIPTIRVPSMGEALAFYRDRLGFTVIRGDDESVNSSLTRGDARIMIEIPTDMYGDVYNAAIEQRLGTPSAVALYMEAPDLDELYERLMSAGEVEVVDPLAERPWGQFEFTVADLVGNWLTFWREPGARDVS
jgi:uncharacterized glyoxalase superfamily protein PhnB